MEYESLNDFAKGKVTRKIVLENAFDGWYVSVKNDYIYFNLSSTNKIIAANLSTDKTMWRIRMDQEHLVMEGIPMEIIVRIISKKVYNIEKVINWSEWLDNNRY